MSVYLFSKESNICVLLLLTEEVKGFYTVNNETQTFPLSTASRPAGFRTGGTLFT